MDPTYLLCSIPSTLTDPIPYIPSPLPVEPPSSTSSSTLPYEEGTYNQLIQLTRQLETIPEEQLDALASSYIPLYPLPKLFMGNGLTLANIDAILKVLPETQGMIDYSLQGPFNSLVLGSNGFAQYLFFRLPRSAVIGMGKEEWLLNSDVLSFYPFYGSTQGDVVTGWKELLQYIKMNYATGIDFLCGDLVGEDALQTQITLGLETLKLGRNMVLQIENIITDKTCEWVYLLTQSFQEVYIFKPCATSPLTSTKFLICKQLLQKGKVNPTKVPKSFQLYLKSLQNQWMVNQIEQIQVILDVYQGNTVVPPAYDIRKPLIVWSLPSVLPPYLTM
jgi:hypothetical protein